MKSKYIIFSVVMTLFLAMVPRYSVAQNSQKRVELHFLPGNISMRGMVIDSKNKIAATIFVTRKAGNKGSIILNDKHYASGTGVSVTIKGYLSKDDLYQVIRQIESAGFIVNQELIKSQLFGHEKKKS
jgi:hypothetical protein